MINLAEAKSRQILLLASDLFGETLSKYLTTASKDTKVFLKNEEVTRKPDLIIWLLEEIEEPTNIKIELRRLQEIWSPSPLLLILPEKIRLTEGELLQFDCAGLLQSPDLTTLKESVSTLIEGGRVIRLQPSSLPKEIKQTSFIGLSQWLLLTGIHQIDYDLYSIEKSTNFYKDNIIAQLILEGRKRELQKAKELIVWIWGKSHLREGAVFSKNKDLKTQTNSKETNILLKNKTTNEVLSVIKCRIEEYIKQSPRNSTGSLLATESLNQAQRTELIIAILNQFTLVINKLKELKDSEVDLIKYWLELQKELRKQALRKMFGSYTRLPYKGELKVLADQILLMVNLNDVDTELPDPELILDPFLLEKPIQIEGQLLPADDPRALIKLELYISNWLIRTSEIVSAELLEVCSQWPEIRKLLLQDELISTRGLERYRNQLNSENRWKQLVIRPIQLYESKRQLYKLSKGSIDSIFVTEPRDDELRNLGWFQQQVALMLETRDALAPQVQVLVRKLGDLMVILLTQVLGRAIGLVGRGIAQGMGRNLGRS